MKLFDQIQKDMYAAMKAGEKTKAGALRVTIAALKDKRIEKREDISGDEQIKVIQTLVKQRKESIDLYVQGGRNDLAEKEKEELVCLEAYLPEQMSEDELRSLIIRIIHETGASGLSDIGKVMPGVMKMGAGEVDGKTAQAMVRKLLQG